VGRIEPHLISRSAQETKGREGKVKKREEKKKKKENKSQQYTTNGKSEKTLQRGIREV
jgi:hypothetical protein